ncbi:hypothetical protein BDV29DRAFT_169466 [Aspergillus leporis]|jgi:hypothetical protein|uniref:Uncharacterized protein n=1 Tax=Aspergillus leporis TaxID=41062 RepID=A0A5N5XBQ6_9EURO|nr:hypothetical protein BDV29DRAFT_169466 [Aspergillus leporis]
MLSFLALSSTFIRDIEARLRDTLDKLYPELGRMFRDQTAAWQFLQEINQLGFVERKAELPMSNERF